MNEIVRYQVVDSVATIVLDDGKVNALSERMLTELQAALDRAAGDADAVVITGRAGVFSAGFDLKALSGARNAAGTLLRMGFETAEKLLAFPKPVVAACSGHAIAMGAFLLLSADYRIGADGAYKIGANEVAIGLTMPRSAIEICRQRLTPSHFSRAVITAEIYAPKEAMEAGFLDRVVAEPELASAAALAAKNLAMLNQHAHAATKLLARDSTLKALHAALEADISAFGT
jgi:enoyl-CoA hydratase